MGVQKLFNQYGEKENFLKVFAPMNIARYSSMPDRCIAGTAPTIHVLEQGYGHETAVAWLSLQFVFINRISNAQVKLDEYQAECLASAILANEELCILKATDIMLFINQFTTGKYGHFYGSVDAQVIGEALYKYRQWKQQRLASIHREQEHQRRERQEQINKANAITYEEYLKLKKQKAEQEKEIKRSKMRQKRRYFKLIQRRYIKYQTEKNNVKKRIK